MIKSWKIKTELTKKEIEELFSVDMEWEKHSVLTKTVTLC